jgi:AcrR family transcriptional regulator
MATTLTPQTYNRLTQTQPLRPAGTPGTLATFGRTTIAPAESASPRRARAKRGDGDRLRLEILDAVDELLVTSKNKEDAVSIRAVADMVGCTPPAIYLHFFDKNELLYEVCARRFLALEKSIDEATAGITDPIAVLDAGARAYVRFGLEFNEHYRILFMGKSLLTPEQLDEMRRTGVTGLDKLVDRCKACIDAGATNAANAKLMAFGIWSIAHGIVSLMIAKPHVEWPKVDALLDHVMGTYISGLRQA